MIYLVTCKSDLSEKAWLERIKELMEEGLDYVIIREKEVGRRARLSKQVMAYKKTHSAIFTKVIIYEDFKLAQSLGADGLHLPGRLWAACQLETRAKLKEWGGIIGCSIHSQEEARQVEGLADYVLVSPIFKPSCKAVLGKGIDWLKNIEIKAERVALGGISPENVNDLYQAGIEHIAVMSYLMATPHHVKDLRVNCFCNKLQKN